MLDLKLLIIDDEVDLCFLLASALRKQIQEVQYVHTLNEGFTQFDLIKPNWLIIDNNLPDGKGWEHLDEFISRNPSINIICISANPDSFVKETNAVTKLIKPLKLDKVIELIKKK
jgi:two-component system, OmpR family, response regulator